MQQMDVALDPDDDDSEIFTFRGGTTVILTDQGEVRYAIQKNLGKDTKDNRRLKRQRDYYQNTMSSMAMAAYGAEELRNFLPRRGRKRPMNFSLVHRGY
jgi:hypothetical protein